MSRPVLIQAPSQGLNTLLPANMIADRESPSAQNVLFSRGLIKTPYGFAKLYSSGLPLNNGDAVIGIARYREKSGYEHIVVVTTDKVYHADNINSEWDNLILNDLTDNVLRANVDNPVSFVAVAHTDGIAIDGGANNAYHHLLICDGGMSPVQRWAGKEEDKLYSLAGADGYHEADTPLVTDHYALQVNIFYNHVILLSPKIWNATSDVFTENQQTVLWGKAGLLEGSNAFAIAETGAGYNELVDTGDANVWSMQLGNQLIIYQQHSIWSCSHVGGSDVFRFRVEIPDIGLLAPHLLVSHGNRHYFLGNNYDIYEYAGGSYLRRISGSDRIRDALKDDIKFAHARRCWMAVGANGARLWIFYVPADQEYITKAYGMDLKTGAWMMRTFDSIWPIDPCVGHWKMNDNAANMTVVDSSSKGNDGTAQQNTDQITTAGKVGSALSFNGTSDYIDLGSEIAFSSGAWTVALWFKADASANLAGPLNFISSDGGYADNIQYFGIQGSRLAIWDVSNNSGWTRGNTTLQTDQWYHAALVYDGNGGYQFFLNGAADSDVIQLGTTDDAGIIRYIGCGTDAASRFFYGVLDNVMLFNKALTQSQVKALYNNGDGTEDHLAGITIDSTGITAVAAIGSQSYVIGETYQQALDSTETYAQAGAAGTTYRDVLEEMLVNERLMFGDSEGNVYQYNSNLTDDDGNDIPAFFTSKVFDYGLPDISKWWDSLVVVAKGEKIVVSYRLDSFQTADDGWVDFAATDLTDEFAEYIFPIDATSKQIQFRFANHQGSTFQIRAFKISAPTMEDVL